MSSHAPPTSLRRRPVLALGLLSLLDHVAPAMAAAQEPPPVADAPPSAAASAATLPAAAAAVEAAASASLDTPAAPGAYDQRPQAQAWAQATAQRHGLNLDAVMAALTQAVYQPSVVRAVMPVASGQRKNWQAYRNRFLDPVRIRAGAAFMERHGDDVDRAEARYGVPAEVILGILGVETSYGRQAGRYRVLDALSTLAFDFPAGRKDRSAFFQDELAQLLVLARRLEVPPESLLGSYAGAMGWPQFMPSSWNKYAIDFDSDGQPDLIRSPVDAIGSVANYLACFNWVRDLPTHYPVDPPADGAALAELLAPDILPSFTVERMQALGARLPEGVQRYPGPLALILLENGEAAPSYYAGTQNFYTLTRYNWSSYYAMAVIELGSIVNAVGRRSRALQAS